MNENTLRNNLLKPDVALRYKFLYNSTDYTDLILADGLSIVSRNVNLSAGLMPIKLNNAGGWLNFLHATNTALGDTAELQVYVSGDAANALTIFKGTVKDPFFDGSVVTLNIKDSASAWIDQKVGSNAGRQYWVFDDNADVIVWDLLTVNGELDSLVSPANTDIDYASFAAWRDQHIRPNSYYLGLRPTGQTIGNLLMLICQMTHSYIWVNNDGKVAFAPPHQPGYAYDEGNTGTERRPGAGRNLKMVTKNILNKMTVRVRYLAITGEWLLSPVTGNDATSIAKFGTFDKTIEGRIVPHMSTASANSYLAAMLTDYAYPQRYFTLIGGIPAIMEDLCNQITVDDTQKVISGATAYIEEINYDLDNWEITMKARWSW